MNFDRGTSIGLFLFGGWGVYMALTIPKTAIRQTVGPEVMPLGISLCIMLAAVFLFVHSLNPAAATEVGEDIPVGMKEDRRTQLLVVAGVVVYLAVFEPLGYILSTSLLCIYETAVFQTGHWIRNLASGIGFAVVIYVIFVKLLEVLLPVGLFGF